VQQLLVKNPSVRFAELVEIPNVERFLQRFVEKDTFDTLKGLSLMAKVGWDGDLRVEAETIAEKALHLPFDQMQKAVKALRDQGVVLSRGKYLYVSPDLLAISAAAALWDERGADLIEIISDLPGVGPGRQLLRRLVMMTDFPPVRKAIERLLAPDGLYREFDDLDQGFASEVFRYLAAALPEEAQEALNRIFGRVTDDRLQNFKLGRREVVWALESLLRWPLSSIGAARIVCRLALAENETVANNATGIFQQYFHAFLSGSPIPLGERLQLVRELLETNEPQKRLLAVKAAGAALAFYEMRMGGDVDAVSQKKFPDEWKPKTWGELWDARRIAINQLSLISKGDDEAAIQAREALYQSVFALLRHGQAKDAVSILRDHPPKNDNDRREVIDSAQRLLEEASQLLDESERETLEKIVANAFGASYFDRLRRWVGRRANADYDLSGGTGYEAADLKAAELAAEGLAQGISREEISWLASKEAENVWVFGKRLGELDTKGTFLERILSATSDDLNCMLLSSYLTGLAGSVGRATSEEILDRLESVRPTIAFAATWRIGPSEEGGRRIVRLMESGDVDRRLYRALAHGNWVQAIPRELTVRIVELMLHEDSLVTGDTAIVILDRMTRAHPDAFADFENLVWKALAAAPVGQGSSAEWQWGELAGRVARLHPEKIAELVLGRLERDPSPHISEDPIIKVLSTATEADPEGVWELVGHALLRSDIFSFRLLLCLQKWYGELIPGAVLVHWAEEHQPRGPVIAAELLAITAPLTERSRALIAAFPENQQILHVFAGNLQTGFFMGPMSANTERVLKTVRQWEQDPDLRIKSWAQRLASQLTKQIAEQKLIEEGEAL